MTSQQKSFTASMARGHSAASASATLPPAMDRNPRASQLPKAFVDEELLRRITLVNGYPVIYGNSSSSTGSSTLSSGWSITGSSVQGDDAPADWVYQLAFGTSLESVSDCEPEPEEEIWWYNDDELFEWVELDYFSYDPHHTQDVGLYDPLQNKVVVLAYEDEEQEDPGYPVEQNWGYSTSSIGLTDDERDDDEGVWGAAKVRTVAPVRPRLMRRQLLSSTKDL